MISDRLQGIATRHPAGRVLVRLVENLDRHDTPRVASAMAFDAFLSLIPLVAIAGFFLQRADKNGAQVLGSLFSAAPQQVVALVDFEFFRLSEAGSAVLAPLSLVAFLWVSSAGLATAMGVFETIYASEHRPWYVRRGLAMGCVVAGLIAIPITAAIGYFIARLSGSLGAQLVGLFMPALILVALVAAFFRIAIRRPRLPQRRVLPGAFVTVFLWALCSALFSLYVAELAQYATLYGNLATVAILMLWLWLLSMALIVGGEVNAELERFHEALPRSSDASKSIDAGRTSGANKGLTPGESASASKSRHVSSAPPAP
jgi:membrane protein